LALVEIPESGWVAAKETGATFLGRPPELALKVLDLVQGGG